MFGSQFRIFKKFVGHFLTARNTGGYGVHSPYLFHFTRFVLQNNLPFYTFSAIEAIRIAVKNDERLIQVEDFGTGKNRIDKISNISSKSLQSPKFAQLFFRIINHYKMRNVLELGTSLGITTSYLAAASSEINCFTLEGSPEIAKIAMQNFEKQGLKNIKTVVGDIDKTIGFALQELKSVDFVYFDANHKYEAVMRYFNACLPYVSSNTIFVFDDIYWSEGMEKAWKEIKNSSSVTSTIDLFQLGIVFFNPDLHKKHFKMRF